MARPDDGGDGNAEWNRLNNLGLSKLKFYVSPAVHKVVWKGERLTALQYYNHL